ncbi:MAG: hypothetical protein Harvfovirus27_9 [Harvfovirus sp.]|uniref:Uncharacterized protein n=1 Tax=Harvfovirus sp. TaxID=2487768 RepID=A0A3G5A2G5_9VIRU|nr:MAG: hypothetical protein Harvfovirus27_9 [Harvfovirus sp.]
MFRIVNQICRSGKLLIKQNSFRRNIGCAQKFIGVGFPFNKESAEYKKLEDAFNCLAPIQIGTQVALIPQVKKINRKYIIGGMSQNTDKKINGQIFMLRIPILTSSWTACEQIAGPILYNSLNKWDHVSTISKSFTELYYLKQVRSIRTFLINCGIDVEQPAEKFLATPYDEPCKVEKFDTFVIETYKDPYHYWLSNQNLNKPLSAFIGCYIIGKIK